jgi:ATP-dependent DNA helicase PIF1
MTIFEAFLCYIMVLLCFNLTFSFQARAFSRRQIYRTAGVLAAIERDAWGEDHLLSTKQKEAMELVQQGSNVFITGVAGTGKSLLLRCILDYLKEAHYEKKKYVAVGPTGPAAIALEGQTIHSFAGIGIPKTTTDFMKVKSRRKQWKDLQVLVLDEASMVSGEFFDLLSDAVSEIRKDPRPFGGIQLIMCGDFLQLSPIAPRNSDIEQMVTALQDKEGLHEQDARELLFLNRGFLFQAHHWQRAGFQVVELDQVFRQQNKKFVDILQDIRKGQVPQSTLHFLRTKCERPLPPNQFGIRPTILHSKNKDVARDNLAELNRLRGETVIYESADNISRDRGAPKWADNQLKRSGFFTNCIADQQLQLKAGAQVMLIKNEGIGPKQLVNGSRGTVVGFRKPPSRASDDAKLLSGVEKYPVVRFVNGEQKIILPKMFESRLVGLGSCTRLAIPLKLAWAITTHKAQGLTLDYVIADLGQVFADAQAYVALSRASDEKGLELRNFSPDRVRANRMALSFYANPNQDFEHWDSTRNTEQSSLPAVSRNTKQLSSPAVSGKPRVRKHVSGIENIDDIPVLDPLAPHVAVSVRNDYPQKTIIINRQATPAKPPPSSSPLLSTPSLLPSSSELKGSVFVFSGVLRFLKKDNAEALVQKHGGLVRKSVSGRTDFLVLGHRLSNGQSVTSGTAYTKAISSTTKRIRIITEKEFLEMTDSYKKTTP